MRILTGLFPHMVLQRAASGASDALITGTSAIPGHVVVRVLRGKKPLPGFAGRTIGLAARGRFTAELVGVPVGGPYTVELSIASPQGHDTGTIIVPDVLVGDVWIAGGQSNMEGCGLLKAAAKPHPMTRAFYMDDHWDVAKDPVHELAIAVDAVHVDMCGGVRPARNLVTGTGPSVAFAQEMYRVTGVPQGILACGHGGTSMTQWDPAKKSEGGKSLYGATLRRVQKNGGKVAGVIWYQGESDADPTNAPLYVRRMKALVGASRRDLKNPSLPWAIVQISRVVGWGDPSPWNAIQEHERRLPAVIKGLTTVPAIDLSLDDGIHISGVDHQRLGRRLAQGMLALVGHPKGRPAIAVKKVSVEPVPQRGTANVVVEFANVVGRLQAGSRPAGFTVEEVGGGSTSNQVFDVVLDGSRAIVRTGLSPTDVLARAISYGRGCEPVCNITDTADRAIPVFGPLPLGKPRAFTPFARTIEVSATQPSAGKLEDLRYPADPASLGFALRTFPDRLCNLHAELGGLAPTDVVVYFRLPVECPEAMKLALLFGYDGPVKVFLDGKQVYHDPNGINPIVMDAHRIALKPLSAGRHELMVALASNNGQAWGMCLRLERMDVPRRLVLKGPGSYLMPQLPQ